MPRLAIALTLLLLTADSAQSHHINKSATPGPLPPESDAPHPEASPPPEPQPLVSRETAIRDAARAYRASGKATQLERPGQVIFPYDHSQPEVRCSPLRACDIELESGEIVRDVALGDSERWVAQPLKSGDVEHSVPHVVVKPKAYGLSTNLVIGTTRRTYHLRLISPRESTRGESADHRHVSFYYPDQLVTSWASGEEVEERRQAETRAASGPQLSGLCRSQSSTSATRSGRTRKSTGLRRWSSTMASVSFSNCL